MHSWDGLIAGWTREPRRPRRPSRVCELLSDGDDGWRPANHPRISEFHAMGCCMQRPGQTLLHTLIQSNPSIQPHPQILSTSLPGARERRERSSSAHPQLLRIRCGVAVGWPIDLLLLDLSRASLPPVHAIRRRLGLLALTRRCRCGTVLPELESTVSHAMGKRIAGYFETGYILIARRLRENDHHYYHHYHRRRCRRHPTCARFRAAEAEGPRGAYMREFAAHTDVCFKSKFWSPSTPGAAPCSWGGRVEGWKGHRPDIRIMQ